VSPLRVSFQGVAGAFGEDAIARHWGNEAIAVPARTFRETVELAVNGTADLAVLPSWNTSIGTIDAAMHVLEAHSRELAVEGEVILPVRHHLLALPGTAMEDVRYVGSHPAALAQCQRFLEANPQMTKLSAFDTAGAAMELAALGKVPTTVGAAAGGTPDDEREAWHGAVPAAGPRSLAVIASERASATYGLVPLVRDVQDDAGNHTCFVILRPAIPRARTDIARQLRSATREVCA
jgi:prephenate dehydratase